MPANPNNYNHEKSFETNGYIDWAQTGKFKVGETVYIYFGSDIKAIQFKTIVEKVDMEPFETTDDIEFWYDTERYYNGKKGLYARLRLVDKSYASGLSYKSLTELGLKGPFQRARKIYNPAVDEYIASFFKK